MIYSNLSEVNIATHQATCSAAYIIIINDWRAKVIRDALVDYTDTDYMVFGMLVAGVNDVPIRY